MEARRDPRSFLFFIILLLIINSPEPQSQSFHTRNHYDEILEREWTELDVLNRTHYGDFDAPKDKWLNISGLRDEDGFAWDLFQDVKEKATEVTRKELDRSADAWLDGTITRQQVELPIYQNVSGYVQGEWVRDSRISKVRHPRDMNVSAAMPEAPFPYAEFDRNITGTGGMVRIHFVEMEGRSRTDANKSISELSARVVLGDRDSWGGNWFEFTVHGVHFPEFGGAVLTTTSEKFGGIFALPHFQLSPHLYSRSQELLNRTIHETIDRQMNRAFPIWNPWSSAVDGSNEGALTSPHCEFVLWLQQSGIWYEFDEGKPWNDGLGMEWLEHEMRYPTGAPLPRRWSLSMSMVGFSPDCGFVIQSKGPPEFARSEADHLTGSKTEEFNDRAKHSITAFAVTLAAQLFLLIKQMKETATPSTRNRVSFYTIAILAMGDGFSSLALIFMHLFLGTSQLPLYAIAFLSLFSVIFELRFLMDIWTVQVTEQMRQDRQQATSTPMPGTPTPTAANEAPPTPAPPTSNDGGLPLPVTASRPAAAPSPPIIISSDQDEPLEPPTPNPATNTPATATPARAELGALYSRYCLLLIGTFFVTLQFTTVRFTARAFYFNTLSFLYLSFWIPQIHRNIMRNCRKALRWDFVLGQSVVRLLPICYFYAWPHNVMFARTDLRALAVLAGWLWLQILALISQEVLGSRFFIKDGWAPPAYDYHPVLREDEEGGTMPIGSDTSSPDSTIQGEAADSPTKSPPDQKTKRTRTFDCTICATDITVPIIPSSTSTSTSTASSSENAAGMGAMILQRRAYMVTPCRHIFHTGCLEGWMRYRLVCPNCRDVLPPL